MVGAVGVTLVDDGTTGTVTVTDAVDLYAYEITFTEGGTIASTSASGFLTGTTTEGYNERGDYLYVYESRLDPDRGGDTGDGEELFTVTHSDGTLVLDSALFIDIVGTETTVSYVVEDDGTITVVTSVSGGGGGGAATVNIQLSPLPDLVVTPEELNINAISEGTVEREITVINSRDEYVNLQVILEGFDGSASVSTSYLSLAPGEQGVVILKVDAGERGLITGKVRFRMGAEIVAESTVVVNIMSENFLFDSSISLLSQFRTIAIGQNLIAQIDLEQVGPEEKVDVVANYIVKDFSGNSYLEDSETFYVLGDKSFTKDFHTADLKPGKYVLALEIVYPGAFATSSVQFEVKERKGVVSSLLDVNLILIISLSIAIVLIAIAIVWAVRGRKSRRKKRRR